MTAAVKKRRHGSTPSSGREFRKFATDGLEVRSDDGSDSVVLSGLAIRYGVPYEVRDLFGTFVETMLPGVANAAVARGADTRFLIDHAGMPLARTVSGTLSLDTTNPQGLGITASLDARSSMANDLAVAVERGDISQMSCGFVVARDTWPDDCTRMISELGELFDVSAVTYPASPTTTIELAQRSLMAQPIETQARVRQLWVDVDEDLRSGQPVSQQTARRFQTALIALQQVGDPIVQPAPSAPATPGTAAPDGLAELAARAAQLRTAGFRHHLDDVARLREKGDRLRLGLTA